MRIQCPNCHLGLEIVPDTPNKDILCPSCGSQLDLTVTTETVSYRTETRRTIGHFELLDQVGQGHFGAVWRARDTELQRIVAVKIPRTADLSPAEKEMFFREARTAAKLRHSNIVPIHEVGNEDGTIFIVSDFIPGITLAEELRIGNPTFQQSAQWCATVADALDYAHENGVIHRDMKPGNVMLEKDKPYVLDFGLAKHEASDFTITTEGEILGTPAYMSPEQASGQSGSADRRCDVYSLGTVLYQMITGRKPFQGGTRALMHQILHDEPTAPRKIKKEVPRDLETICLRAMAKEPGRRYPTTKEMADDLRRFLAGEAIRARPERWHEQSWRWARRNPALSSTGGVAVTAILLLVLSTRWWLFAAPLSPQLMAKEIRLEVFKREHVDPKSAKTPAQAEVIFWRLDPVTGDPIITDAVRASGISPLSAKLVPGDYLVVVVIPQHGFHEVYRHVQGANEGIVGSYKHQRSQIDALGVVILPEVEVIPLAEVESGMTRFVEKDFTLGSKQLDEAFAHKIHVAGFLLDTSEMTIGEYGTNFTLPPGVENREGLEDHAVHSLTWSMAMAYAEKMGKRLPEECEYEAAATDYGRTKYPWGNEEPMGEWKLGKVGIPTFDRTKTIPPVEGLYSNVAEWMVNWAAPYPRERNLGLVNPSVHRERVVRGAPTDVIEGRIVGPTTKYESRQRPAYDQAVSKPGLGFRCARSTRPRLKAQDFSRLDESK